MAIKIRKIPYTRLPSSPHPGPFEVFPDQTFSDVMVIAMAGTDELPESLGEDETVGDPDYIHLLYDPGPQPDTDVGRVRQLVKDLIDDPGELELVGVGADFLWPDGSTIFQSAGGRIGGLIWYDSTNCEGDGRWVRGTDGNEVCTTSAGILFHEMAHERFNHGTGDIADEEMEAVDAENDLRSAQSLVARDRDKWPESDCGCPGGCCIVASVASASPFSIEVHGLRGIRDGVLRKTRFGRHLFDAIHSEYYRFSVGVCRVMVSDAAAQEDVLHWLVRPLVRVLQLLVDYTRSPEDVEALGRALLADRDDGFVFESRARLGWKGVDRLLRQVCEGRDRPPKVVAIDAGTREIFSMLAAHLPACKHVRWAIVEPLRIYAAARAGCGARARAATVGRKFAAALDAWAARVPLGYVAEQMSIAELAAEMGALRQTLFASEPARRAFGGRLLESGEIHVEPRLERAMRAEGYL